MRYLLSICIPNYNRIDKLEGLIKEIIKQIYRCHAQEDVQICISDDASSQNPDALIEKVRVGNPQISITYKRNTVNKGMDYNFLQSVLISDAEFCWIVGNDDLLESHAVEKIMLLLEEGKKNNIALIVTPFNVYSSDGNYLYTVKPLKGEQKTYNWLDAGQKKAFVTNVNHESAIFAFLSNTIFRRNDWITHGNMFADKMNSIFIQMYMNLQTMFMGGKYFYANEYIIKNFIDTMPDGGFEQRMYKIAVGLYDVLGYFFDGKEKKDLQERIVTPFVIDKLWLDMDKYSAIKEFKIRKSIMYKKHFVDKYSFVDNKDMSVIIFGAGKTGKENAAFFISNNLNVVMYVDNNLSIQKKLIKGIPVLPVKIAAEYIARSKNTKIVLSSCNMDVLEEMDEQLSSIGIKKENIVII